MRCAEDGSASMPLSNHWISSTAALSHRHDGPHSLRHPAPIGERRKPCVLRGAQAAGGRRYKHIRTWVGGRVGVWACGRGVRADLVWCWPAEYSVQLQHPPRSAHGTTEAGWRRGSRTSRRQVHPAHTNGGAQLRSHVARFHNTWHCEQQFATPRAAQSWASRPPPLRPFALSAPG